MKLNGDLMSFKNSLSKVVVIGAGILGVSSAVQLARRGIETIIINDGPPSNGASGRSLSWLNSSRRRSDAYHLLRMTGIDRYRTLASRYPEVPWLRFDGGLTWDADDATNDIAAVYRHEIDLAYDAQLLAPDEIASATPGIDVHSVTPQGAIFNPGEGWVDLPSLIEHQLREFGEHGGKLVTDAGKAAVAVSGGRVTGVTTARGDRVDADAVLLATGPAVPAMAAETSHKIANATPIALLVQTRPVHLPLRAVLNTPRVAVRPTPTGALVLDSAWSEEEVVTNPDGSYSAPDSTVAGLLTEASRVLEGNPVLELDRIGIGPKPIPGDGEPVFGELDGIAGYHVAFSHSGATLGLIAGELLAFEIATGEHHPMLEQFRPSRFANCP